MLTKGSTFPVHDHGYVKLIDWMGSDEDVVSAARQSTRRSFEGWGPGKICEKCRARPESHAGRDRQCEEDGGDHVWGETRGDLPLLTRLWRDKHTTPFEMIQMKVEVQGTIMSFREWHRHRTQSYSEMSARYVQMPNLHYVPQTTRVKGQSKTNKQGSDGQLPPEVVHRFLERISNQQQEIYGDYELFLQDGVSRELARLNTPVSRYSRMQASANLLNWFRFLGLRKPNSAQEEIRVYADVVGKIISELFPRCHELFEEYTLYSRSLSRTDLRVAGEALSVLDASASESTKEALSKLRTILGISQ